MSGSTVVRQRGKRYEVRLATPSISFAPDPARPGDTSHERDYHAHARRQFEATLAPLEGTLDEAMERIARDFPDVELIAVDNKLPVANDHARVAGPCQWSSHLGSPPVHVGWSDGTLTLAFAKLPDGATRERLFSATAHAIWTILVAHHDRVQHDRRTGAVPDQPTRFHYTRAFDGTVMDYTYEAPGGPITLSDLAPPAALELCASVAAVIAIAEEDGVVHADLDVSDLRVTAVGLSVDRFGEVTHHQPGHPPEGTSDLMLPIGRRIDWTLRQRYSLGYVCYELLARHTLDVPRTPRDSHDDAVAHAIAELDLAGLPDAAQRSIRSTLRALLAWAPDHRPSARDAWAAFAAHVPAHAPPSRRDAAKVPDRLAADTRGVLVPCWKCKRPALRHAGRNAGTADNYGPDCCSWDRERRMLRLIAITLVMAIASALVWWLR